MYLREIPTQINSKPTRRESRLAWRKIRRMIELDGDNCSLCRAPFSHNDLSFCGITHNGRAAVAGECCASRIRWMMGAGLYINKDSRTTYDFMERNHPDATRMPATPEEIAEAVAALRAGINAADQFKEKCAKYGGMSPNSRGTVSLLDNPWKTDDRKWFEDHPERSHRLRQTFDGELPPEFQNDNMPGHEHNTIVRQIAPGERVRVFFYRRIDAHIPDIEPVIHALFDTVAGGQLGAGELITSSAIAEPALKIAQAAEARQ